MQQQAHTGATEISWQRQIDVYNSFTADQLRTFYQLRRQWRQAQAEARLRLQRRQEFIRYLVQHGHLES